MLCKCTDCALTRHHPKFRKKIRETPPMGLMTFMAVLGTLENPQFHQKSLWPRNRFGDSCNPGQKLEKLPTVRLRSPNLRPQYSRVLIKPSLNPWYRILPLQTLGLAEWSDTQTSSRSEAIRILLGPGFCEFYEICPFFEKYLETTALEIPCFV